MQADEEVGKVAQAAGAGTLHDFSRDEIGGSSKGEEFEKGYGTAPETEV